jgi:hypothetical protein
VSNSLYNVEWWSDLRLWWLRKTPLQWEQEGGSPYELCALHWKRQVMEILVQKDHVPPAQYMECRYEDLILNPRATLESILHFCRLEAGERFWSHVDTMSVRGSSLEKWQEALDASQKRTIGEAAGDLLTTLGYGVLSGS